MGTTKRQFAVIMILKNRLTMKKEFLEKCGKETRKTMIIKDPVI
jgi:hypothetical protein